jgi:hypothetical protein
MKRIKTDRESSLTPSRSKHKGSKLAPGRHMLHNDGVYRYRASPGTWARGLPSLDQGLDPPKPACQCITSPYWFQGCRLLVQSALDSFTSNDFPLVFRDVHGLSQRAMRLNVKPPSSESRHVSELMVRTQRLDHTAVEFSDVPGSYTARHAAYHCTY